MVLLCVYALVALLPIALTYLQGLPRRAFIDELSSTLAMLAFAVLLMEFVLSGRFKHVSGPIGIDLTMRFHQLMARALTVVILIHPFVYTTPLRAPLPWDTTNQLSLTMGPLALLSGFVGWLLLAPLVLFAIFRDQLPYRYETWRLSHGLGAALIAVLGLHHVIDGGRYSADPQLELYWLVMVGAALFSLVYVYLLTPLLQLRHPYRISSVRNVAAKTWELTLEPHSGEVIEFEAGQFCWLTLNRSAFALTEHPFSMSSAPSQRKSIAFTIKQAGDFTNQIASMPIGARAYLDGPHGRLTLSGREGTGIAFIAGGVGLAPIMSILRQLCTERDQRPMKLIYGNRFDEQIMFADELRSLGDYLDIAIHHVLSEPPAGWEGEVGWLDENVLSRYCSFDSNADWLYMVCGPSPMIASVERTLAHLGVPRRQVVSEKFSYD